MERARPAGVRSLHAARSGAAAVTPVGVLRCARRIVALLTLTGAGVLATATAAFAHAVLVSSNPAEGATLTTPPATVSLTFSEDVRAPAFVVVTGPGGTRVDGGASQILNRTVTERLRAARAAGTYTIAYRVVSADGHPIEGELRYRLAQAAPASTTPAPAAASPAPAPAAASTTQAAAATPTAPASGGDDGHLVHVLGGLAVVLAGVAALMYERFQRRRHPEDSGASP
jgi:copper resistance protein C